MGQKGPARKKQSGRRVNHSFGPAQAVCRKLEGFHVNEKNKIAEEVDFSEYIPSFTKDIFNMKLVETSSHVEVLINLHIL